MDIRTNWVACVLLFALASLLIQGFAMMSAHAQDIGGLGDKLNKLLGGITETLSSNITLGKELSLYNTTNLLSPAVIVPIDNNVYVASTEIGNSSVIRLWGSKDEGTTFRSLLNQSDDISLFEETILAASGNNVYLVWVAESPEGNHIMLRTSNENGSSFRDAISLNTISDYQLPVISASGDNVYISWLNESNGKSNLLMKHSSDAGSTFDETIDIFNSSNVISGQSIVAFGNGAYLVWKEITPGADKVYFKKLPGSNSESSITVIGNKSSLSGGPIIRASSDKAYVVWKNGSYNDIETVLVRVANNGTSFNSNLLPSRGTGLEAPLLSTSDKKVYVGWITPSINKSSVLVASSTDEGITFDNGERLFTFDLSVNKPMFAASEPGLYTVWSNSSGLFLKRSFEDLSEIRTLTSTYPSSPVVAADGLRLYIAWDEINPNDSFDAANIQALKFLSGKILPNPS